jgi:hypothetical protein
MGTCDDPVEAALPPITAPTASELPITADNYLTYKRKHAVVIIEKMTAAEFFLRLILLRKDLRIPLFSFLRLNVVVWYRVSRTRRAGHQDTQDTQNKASRHGRRPRDTLGQETQARQNKQDTHDAQGRISRISRTPRVNKQDPGHPGHPGHPGQDKQARQETQGHPGQDTQGGRISRTPTIPRAE